MGKTTNIELATKVSERIQELLNQTALKLEGLAVLCNIGKSAIKSYFSKTLPISLENIDKICTPFALKLSVFLDFDIPLPTGLKQQRKFKEFYNNNINNYPNYFVIPKKQGKKSKYVDNDKNCLTHVIQETDYFYSARLTQEMVVDFKNEYNVEFESGRLSQLLQSHLDILDKVPSVKRNKDGSLSKKQVFKYIKKKKD